MTTQARRRRMIAKSDSASLFLLASESNSLETYFSMAKSKNNPCNSSNFFGQSWVVCQNFRVRCQYFRAKYQYLLNNSELNGSSPGTVSLRTSLSYCQAVYALGDLFLCALIWFVWPYSECQCCLYCWLWYCVFLQLPEGQYCLLIVINQ